MQIISGQKIERIFCFVVILAPSFLGYFFVPGPLGDLKGVLGDVFGSTDAIESFQRNVCFFVQKSTFFQGVSHLFWVKKDQIFKSTFFASLCP